MTSLVLSTAKNFSEKYVSHYLLIMTVSCNSVSSELVSLHIKMEQRLCLLFIESERSDL